MLAYDGQIWTLRGGQMDPDGPFCPPWGPLWGAFGLLRVTPDICPTEAIRGANVAGVSLGAPLELLGVLWVQIWAKMAPLEE